MIAKNNEILTSAAQSIFHMNADDLIREQCRAREEYERHERTVQKTMQEQAEAIAERDETIKEQERIIKNQGNIIKKLELDNQHFQTQLAQLTASVQALQAKGNQQS